MSRADWRPSLRLNMREREMCEQEDIVLLLGRSGAGIILSQRTISVLVPKAWTLFLTVRDLGFFSRLRMRTFGSSNFIWLQQ